MKCIVTTTINAPTEAIRRYDRMDGWKLIVVGDKKTPHGYELDNGVYLSPQRQQELSYKCVDVVPWGKIQRRNIGMLYALELGADVIATIDDDNIPYSNWSSVNENAFNAVFRPEGVIRNTEPCSPYRIVDPLSYAVTDGAHADIWHRGYPIQRMASRDSIAVSRKQLAVLVGVQAGLWDGEPDVDAVCRIARGPFDLTMKLRGLEQSVCIDGGSYAPFNTQNTSMRSSVAAVMGLPYSIGRMDDIWAGFVAQKLMRHVGLSLVFVPPTVRQDRNDHDLSKDLETEMIGYRHTDEFLSELESIDLSGFGKFSAVSNMFDMYTYVTGKLASLKFLDDDYKKFIDAWTYDVERILRG